VVALVAQSVRESRKTLVEGGVSIEQGERMKVVRELFRLQPKRCALAYRRRVPSLSNLLCLDFPVACEVPFSSHHPDEMCGESTYERTSVTHPEDTWWPGVSPI